MPDIHVSSANLCRRSRSSNLYVILRGKATKAAKRRSGFLSVEDGVKVAEERGETMSEKSSVRLKQLHGRLGDLVYQFTKVQFSQSPAAEVWSPAVNSYRCEQGFAICVDLAGVPKDSIELEIEKRKIRLQGRRETPEPKERGHEAVQILAMEIDSGGFAREISLPADVDPACVRAEYKEGLLWIYLPFRCAA